MRIGWRPWRRTRGSRNTYRKFAICLPKHGTPPANLRDLPKPSPFFAFPNLHELRSSPERVKNGSRGYKRDFALIQPLVTSGKVSPILLGLLNVIENTSFAFIDLSQDETRVAGRGRVEIRRVRK